MEHENNGRLADYVIAVFVDGEHRNTVDVVTHLGREAAERRARWAVIQAFNLDPDSVVPEVLSSKPNWMETKRRPGVTA